MRIHALLAALAVAACQPSPLHQGGVVFVAPPGGFSVVGRVQAAGPDPAARPRVRLVAPGGAVAEATVAADGSFRLDHVPASGAALVAALHVEAGGLRGYVEHDSGAGARRRWLAHAPGEVYDLGVVQLAAGGATGERNPLARYDHDRDGQLDLHDLDDDNDGTPDLADLDDLNHGHHDDYDPLGP